MAMVWVRAGSVAMLCALGAVARGAGERRPSVFQTDGRAIAAAREAYRKKDPAVARAVAALLKRADKALTEGPYSVTFKKKPLPGVDVHEYVSLAPYHWPNPGTKDGLPYVRHDGRRNPEVNDYDLVQLDGFSGRAYTLGVAAYVTGERKYAERAAQLVRVFLLDDATAMRPNLEHGQMIRGENTGRNAGMIESRRFLGVVDAIQLIRDSGAWTADDQRRAEDWFRRYVNWMQTSKLGRKEGDAPNNHGVWYDVQVTTFRLFLGDEAGAREVAEAAKGKRIAKQIEPDGSMPKELARTKSQSYSTFCLLATCTLADLGERVGVDLWHYEGPEGRSIRRTIEFLLPYASGEKKWEHEQIVPYNPAGLRIVLERAAEEYDEPRYREAAGKLKAGAGELDEGLPGTQF